MDVKPNGVLQGMAGAMIWLALPAGAQAQTPPAPAPAAPPTWSVGPIDFSGFIDGYYSYKANRPSNLANGQINDLYNFNDKTDRRDWSNVNFFHKGDTELVKAQSTVRMAFIAFLRTEAISNRLAAAFSVAASHVGS
jgi:hypothetical protein